MNALTETWLRLLANGHDPVPVVGKIPPLAGWPTLKIDAAEVRTWERRFPNATGAGVRGAALDFDIKDPEAADAARQEIDDWLGERGHVLRRTGVAPKFLVPLRTAAPVAKIAQRLRAPNGVEGRIEFLCAPSQQYIAAGIHPDTRKPYTWDGRDLENTPRDELPEINGEEARELVQRLSDLLVEEFGYERIEGAPPKNGNGHAAALDPNADVETLLAAMVDGTFNATHCHVIPRLIRLAWHPGEITDFVVEHTKRRKLALGMPWRDKHERGIIAGRVRSTLRNLFTAEYDHRTSTIPDWLAPDFHADWMAVLAKKQRPELRWGTTGGWAVHAIAINGHDAGPAEEAAGEPAAEAAPSIFAVPLTVADWKARDLPPPDRLIGEWFTTTSRVYLSADTGIGKTSVGMALGVHGGAGLDFLHWQVHRQARILYIDGEMSRRLFQRRINEAVARLGVDPAGTLFLSKEDIEGFPPLNTPTGIPFLLQLIEYIGGVDAVMFDNIMALLVGDQKDELSWNAILPLVSELTKRSVGQIWIDHTGHDATRGYGSKTKQWRMDTVIHLTAVERADTDISFQLEFRKARERTPETRADFEDIAISLVDDQWVSDSNRRQPEKPSPTELAILRVFDELLCGSNIVTHKGRRAVHSKVWGEECIRRALVKDENAFRALRSRLAQKYQIECDKELSWKP